MNNRLNKFIKNFFQNHKLSQILKLCIALWLLLATILIGLSINTSWRLEERGTAINEVGSLRKRVLHMLLLVDTPNNNDALKFEYHEFERILQHIQNQYDSLSVSKTRRDQIQKQLSSIKHDFKNFWIILSNYPQEKNNYKLLLVQSESFISEINSLVLIIERDNTSQINSLRWLQFLILLLAFFSAIISFILLKKLVIQPLEYLKNGLLTIKNGNLNARLKLNNNTEFKDIAFGFNLMAERLKHIYDNLENVVTDKTEALQKKNKELTFLYEISSIFQECQDKDSLIKIFIQKVRQFSLADACSVQLIDRKFKFFDIAGSSGLTEEDLELIHTSKCMQGKCCQLNHEYRNYHFILDCTNQVTCKIKKHFAGCLSFSIQAKDKDIGFLNFYSVKNLKFTQENQYLISTICNQFGIILDNMSLNENDKQLAVLEERNLLAQGLHDSIAQSLSFLNMQVQVLQDGIIKKDDDKIKQTLSMIDEGIQQCYEDVRELLSNFRVKLSKENFLHSLQSVIDRYNKQNRFTINFEISGKIYELTSEEELQILFIVQEALSNVRKHACATEVNIEFLFQEDEVSLEINDNGIGFNVEVLQEKKEQGHVGTIIMEERTNKISGLLKIESSPKIGTIVKLVVPRKNPLLKA